MRWKQGIIFYQGNFRFLLNSFSWSYSIELKNIWHVVATSSNHDTSGEVSVQQNIKNKADNEKQLILTFILTFLESFSANTFTCSRYSKLLFKFNVESTPKTHFFASVLRSTWFHVKWKKMQSLHVFRTIFVQCNDFIFSKKNKVYFNPL